MSTSDYTISLTRTGLVFICSLIIVMGILNFPILYTYLSGLGSSDSYNEEAANRALETSYKLQYGTSQILIPTESNLENSLQTIGIATTQLNTSTRIESIEQPSGSVANSASANQEGLSSSYITIPKINDRAPVIIARLDNQVLNNLKRGVVLYPGSALPGNSGTTVIIGHSSSNFPFTKYSTVFSKINQLQLGDTITISYEGKNYSYIIQRKEIGSVKDLASSHLDNDLILGTCWPIGTDKNRIIVAANLAHNI